MHEKRLSPIRLCCILLVTLLVAGCAGQWAARNKPPRVIEDKDFVIVTVQPEESLASLAHRYLGSFDRAWVIADYNGIQKVVPGDRVVIPLRPVTYGGLRQDGYQAVPVLYYPRLSKTRTHTKAIPAGVFETQMRFLQENGFRTVSLDRFDAFLNFQGQLPPKAIIISFDTTQRWVYDIAYPILLRHHFKAALFVRTDRIDTKGHLTWQELAKLAAAGFDIGTSGMAGGLLTAVAPGVDPEKQIDALEVDLSQAREIIQKQIKLPCNYFAYPGGKTNDLVIALLKKHGYKAAFTRQPGTNPFFARNFRICRKVVQNEDGLTRFRQHLTTFIPAELR